MAIRAQDHQILKARFANTIKQRQRHEVVHFTITSRQCAIPFLEREATYLADERLSRLLLKLYDRWISERSSALLRVRACEAN
jgi:hypothetical protein